MATQKQVADFIAKVAPLAQKDMKTSGILASITLTQACVESAYGTSELATKAKALFGIKKNGWTKKTYIKKSYEYENGKKVLRQSVFRAYDSWQESINDQSDYLRTRKADGKNLTYKKVVGETDYKKAAKALQAAGYSTYPNYAAMLIALIKTYNMDKYDKTETTAKKNTTKKKVKIFLDAGHGGKDPGATSGSRKESADVLKLVKAVGAKLTKAGLSVVYDRTSNVYHSPSAKAEKANKNNVDYFFSFHRNCFNGHASGYETLYYSSSTKMDKLRKEFASVMKKQGFVIRTDKKRTDLAVLRKTKAPALLLEVGFIDSKVDNKIFDQKFDQIAESIAKAIIKIC